MTREFYILEIKTVLKLFMPGNISLCIKGDTEIPENCIVLGALASTILAYIRNTFSFQVPARQRYLN